MIRAIFSEKEKLWKYEECIFLLKYSLVAEGHVALKIVEMGSSSTIST